MCVYYICIIRRATVAPHPRARETSTRGTLFVLPCVRFLTCGMTFFVRAILTDAYWKNRKFVDTMQGSTINNVVRFFVCFRFHAVAKTGGRFGVHQEGVRFIITDSHQTRIIQQLITQLLFFLIQLIKKIQLIREIITTRKIQTIRDL